MSRRALSYSKSKPYVSPCKDPIKCSYDKCSKISENKYDISRFCSSHTAISFISGLKTKLRDKYNSTALGIKKISEVFPHEITIAQFKTILKELKLKYSELEFKEFFKIYGKSHKTSGFVGISVDSLTKCIHSSAPSFTNRTSSIKLKKNLSLIKTHSFSTRSSSNVLEESANKLNYTLPHAHHLELMMPKASDKKVFIDHLLEIFGNPEAATEYFFTCREWEIYYEDFLESLFSLGIREVYVENQKIFASLAKNKKCLGRNEFYQEIFNAQCVDTNENFKLLEEIRNKMKKTFGNYMKAFEEISTGSSFIAFSMLETVVKKLNIPLEKNQISDVFARYSQSSKMYFKEFKEFWIGSEGVCLIKSCEELSTEDSSYCIKHFQCILLKGEEIYGKLQVMMKKEQLNQFFQQVMKDDVKSSINLNGIELQKRELQALKEILKLKNNGNRPTSSSSVKNRVYELFRLNISKSPNRRIVKKCNK